MKRQHEPKGRGPNSAGQAGDDQGLPDSAEADSESVEELVNEGQFFEAAVAELEPSAQLESGLTTRIVSSWPPSVCERRCWYGLRLSHFTSQHDFAI
jgi:hypothetical protein